MRLYIVSTVNNLRKMGTGKEIDNSIVINRGEEKHILNKGYYMLSDLKMKFLGIISAGFFKENFKVGGLTELKLELKNGSKIILHSGVFAYLKNDVVMDEEDE